MDAAAILTADKCSAYVRTYVVLCHSSTTCCFRHSSVFWRCSVVFGRLRDAAAIRASHKCTAGVKMWVVLCRSCSTSWMYRYRHYLVFWRCFNVSVKTEGCCIYFDHGFASSARKYIKKKRLSHFIMNFFPLPVNQWSWYSSSSGFTLTHFPKMWATKTVDYLLTT